METHEDSLGQRGQSACTNTHMQSCTHTLHGSQGIAANEGLVHPCAYSHHCVPKMWMDRKFTPTHTHTHNIHTCRETVGRLSDVNPYYILVMQT